MHISVKNYSAEYRSDNSGLAFYSTNESLRAIVAGLEPNIGERILAVCGSGDAPFALLESGANVTAIDWNLAQLRFTARRAMELRNGNNKDFLNLAGIKGDVLQDYSISYFNEPGRIYRIRRNLPKLSLIEGDINSVELSRDFDKIYLSNVLLEEKENILPFLRIGGLLYRALPVLDLSMRQFKIDWDKTAKADEANERDLNLGVYNWNPQVYVKTS